MSNVYAAGSGGPPPSGGTPLSPSVASQANAPPLGGSLFPQGAQPSAQYGPPLTQYQNTPTSPLMNQPLFPSQPPTGAYNAPPPNSSSLASGTYPPRTNAGPPGNTPTYYAPPPTSPVAQQTRTNPSPYGAPPVGSQPNTLSQTPYNGPPQGSQPPTDYQQQGFSGGVVRSPPPTSFGGPPPTTYTGAPPVTSYAGGHPPTDGAPPPTAYAGGPPPTAGWAPPPNSSSYAPPTYSGGPPTQPGYPGPNYPVGSAPIGSAVPPPGVNQRYPPPPGYQGQPAPGSYQGQPPLNPNFVAPTPPLSSTPQQVQPQAHPAAAPAPRIDPSQIPSPATVADGKTVKYKSAAGQIPPPAAMQYVAIDEANCTSRFIRMTMYSVPTNDDILATSKIPLAAIIQPLAEVSMSEDSVLVVDHGAAGPARCRRCRAYINPYSKFVDGGRRYLCRFCQCENDVPESYFSPLEPSGKRHDYFQRPELSRGSVDFVAPPEYYTNSKPPLTPNFVFVIDVSEYSHASGLLTAVLTSIRHILSDLESKTSSSRVGFITYDATVHFWNMRESRQQPQMLVVSDLTNVFVPLADGFFVDYKSSKTPIDFFLERLPSMFSGTKSNEAVLAAAVEAASLALETTGGRIFAFLGGHPGGGEAAIKKRDEAKLVGTDKEKSLYVPTNPYYKTLGTECASRMASVNLFIASPAPVDVASLSVLVTSTGGNLRYYPVFNVDRDGESLRADLTHLFLQPFGVDAIAKVRCSPGLSVSEYLGNFRLSKDNDLEFASIDCDQAITVTLKYDDKIDEKSEPCIQFAMLYTSAQGERRIRVHTLALTCTSAIGNLFRGADLDAITNLYARVAVREMISSGTLTARQNMMEKCVEILAAYRKFCASTTAAGQLILPESLKLLPVYVIAMSKNPLLRGGADTPPDERVFYMTTFNTIPCHLSTPLVYPRMYALHKLATEVGLVDLDGRVVLPTPERLSGGYMDADGVYLLEDGQRLYLWLGRNCSTALFSQLFGNTPGSASIVELQRAFAQDHGELSQRVRTIIETIQHQRCKGAVPIIVRPRDLLENKAVNMLVEDRQGDAMSYVDGLCSAHKMITSKLS